MASFVWPQSLKKVPNSSEEQKLFLRCKELVAEKAETEVRDWLQSLHSWLTSHQAKPRYNASEPSEKRMAQRLKWAKKCLKAGQFNLAEQQLLQRCLILGQNGMWNFVRSWDVCWMLVPREAEACFYSGFQLPMSQPFVCSPDKRVRLQTRSWYIGWLWHYGSGLGAMMAKHISSWEHSDS